MRLIQLSSVAASRALVLGAFLMVGSLVASEAAHARDWYVSIGRGKGKKGTKVKPAKDLGNIEKKLVAGDVIHIAEGTYVSKGGRGYDNIIVPVSIIGGYKDDFSKRDPWGAHKTILTGTNTSKNYAPKARLRIDLSKYRGKEMPPIVVDGLIINQGPQNRYKTDKRMMIVRKANPKTGQNPTPDRGALIVTASKTGNLKGKWKITVRNNIVMNAAPTQGAFSVSGHKGSEILIENNAVINCTGTGIYAGTMFHGSDNFPKFTVKNNTVLFAWKYDAYVQSFSGNAFKTDASTVGTAENNVFAFADRFGVLKNGKEMWSIQNNVIGYNIEADYYEASGDAKIKLADLEDEAEWLDESEGNVSMKLKIPVSDKWKKGYGQRVLINRNAVEADIKPQQTAANEVRSILGLPLRADDIKADSPVWLHEMSLEDAIKVATTPQAGGKYGSKAPKLK